MDRFRTMQSFVEVIKLGSFSEAAKILGLSRAMISRHITDLETGFGC
jgi:DNA-binding transcriptional LysR family regulator